MKLSAMPKAGTRANEDMEQRADVLIVSYLIEPAVQLSAMSEEGAHADADKGGNQHPKCRV